MSNQLTQLVPVLDGSNWLKWSEAMKAYLMAQGHWDACLQTILSPDKPEEPQPTTNAEGATVRVTAAQRDAYKAELEQYEKDRAEYKEYNSMNMRW